MKYYSTEELEKYILENIGKIKDVPLLKYNNTKFETPKIKSDDAYCFYADNFYHFEYYERNSLIYDFVTDKLFEITYYVIYDIIFRYSTEYCISVNQSSSRGIMFEKCIELMFLIGVEYGKKAISDIFFIIQNSPFSENETKEYKTYREKIMENLK
jgi:hypothetical protein